MKDFLFAVILSFALMVSVAAIAVLVPGAKYVFAFCGACALAFVALAHYERRRFERDEKAKASTYSQWDQLQARTHRTGQAVDRYHVREGSRAGRTCDTVRE